MAVTDVYQLALFCSSPVGRDTVSVLHYEQVQPTSNPVGTLMDAFEEMVIPAYTVPLSAELALKMIRVKQKRGGEAEGESTFLIPGTATGQRLPPQSAGLIRLRTGLSGKRRRGRVYIPGGTEEAQSGGLWSNGHIAALLNLGNALINVGDDGGGGPLFKLTIWSRKDLLSYNVTHCQVDPIVRSQRRRNQRQA